MNEQTPLLVVVNIPPRRQRYPHNRLRRCCSCFLGTALVIVVILILFPLAFSIHGPWSSYLPGAKPFPHEAWPFSQGVNYTELQNIVLTTPSEKKAKEWSKYYTSGPHLAGKNLSQAIWTRERWEEFGVKSSIVAYDIYVNYPVDHRLALLEASKKKSDKTVVATKKEYEVKYECSLEEDVLDEDDTTGLKDRIPTFHGYSANGNVTAPYVYVNFGTYQDFEDLVKANVSLKGKIALAKYGGVFRGLKVKRAQELGMVGTVIYSDPQEDGEVTEENGYKPYPKGPARNPSAVQRGSTQFLSTSNHEISFLSLMLMIARYSSWRSNNSWISFETWCPTC
jgi:N-acetylated-alpha-linked acidic dipeptidase